MTRTIVAPPPSETSVRLAPGFHLVPTDDSYLLYRPDGQFARLRAPRDHLAALAALLDGEPVLDTHSSVDPSSGPDPEVLAALVEAFCAEGVAERAAEIAKPSVTRRVHVDGEGAIADVLIERLTAGGLDVCFFDADRFEADRFEADRLEADAPAARATTDVVVTCSGWMSDALLQERDAWCVAQGVAWHGVYAEGRRFHLGPFWLPDDPSTVRYADARARRLAADVHPDGLEAYWRYLDAGVRVPPLDPPTAAEAALVAGALAADLLAWADGSRPPSHGHQLALDRTTHDWRRHPILPVPRGLMTEAVP